MKSLYLRAIMAIACAVGLVACGGSSGNLILGGSISGLTKEGLVLTNNNAQTVTVPAGATSYAFADLINDEDGYSVTVKTQPTGAFCTVVATTAAGKANVYNSQYVAVTCVTDTHKLGAAVTGLTNTGLALVIGSTNFVPTPNVGSFDNVALIADGSPYGVTILSQPTGQECKLTNATGIMGSGDILPTAANALQVNCTNLVQ